ncbi:MAG: sulfatase-like hydrolase/transferase [Clostridiales bacterium]|nr:sulfatase-like hydrolase/transferase [Clostridiales bacterium]
MEDPKEEKKQETQGEVKEVKPEVKKEVRNSVPEIKRPWIHYLTLAWLPIVNLIFEICFSLMVKNRFSFYTALLSLSFSCFLTAIVYAFPWKRVRIIAIGVLTNILTLIYIAQYIYFRIFGTIFVFASISSGGTGAVVEYRNVVKTAILQGWWGILILLLPSVLYWLIGRLFVKLIPVDKKRYALSVAGAFAVVTALGLCLILTDKKGAPSTRRLYITEFSQDASLQRFGLLPTMGLDFRFNVLHLSVEEKASVDVSDIVIETLPSEQIASKPKATPTPPPPTQAPDATPTPTPTPYPKNVLDIDFDLNETNKTYQKMNEFFSQRQPTTMNEYTGRFAGKNLILITAEAFSGFVIDENLTPTLYKLSTEGFIFNNFYTPVWYVSTSDGEFVETTGLIPKSGVWSYTKIADNYMPFGFGNQFAALGYQTYAYHNNTYTYYHRDKSYPVMGYTYHGLGNGLDVKKTWPESDVEMIEKSVPEYLNGQPFHVYYMTVSGHLQYTYADNAMSTKNRSLVQDLDYCTAVRAYIACQIELDRALELLLQELEAAGELENTVIAMGADHYPYGLENSEYEELAGKDLSLPFSLFENTFILWCGDMEEPVIVDKYCSSLDIAPTLANLFGLPYDSRLYIGTDIFAPEPNWVIFNDRSFINDKIMYNARNRKVTVLVDEDITDEYIKECVEYVDALFTHSANIIEKDYYGYLFPDGVPWEQ